MKKKVKGFTLIELLVAMAVAGIILTAAIQFFNPVNDLFQEVSFEEKSLSVMNGVNRYISESIRYSKYIVVYANYDQPPTKEQVLMDMRALNSTELSDTAIDDATLSNRIKGVYFDNTKPFTYNNKSCKGRVLKIKNLNDSPRVALTSSYYGTDSLFIRIPQDLSDASKLQISGDTMNVETYLLNKTGGIEDSSTTKVDFLNMNSKIKGQISYFVSDNENTYIYYYRPYDV